MVIYYSRDPQGRRVEVQVSQAEHTAIQSGGGWRQSGAEAHYRGQTSQAFYSTATPVAVQTKTGVVTEAKAAPVQAVESELAAKQVAFRREAAERVAAIAPPTPPPERIVDRFEEPAIPRLDVRPEVRERFEAPGLPRFEMKPVEFIRPPVMRTDIQVTKPTGFTMYRPPRPEIKMGPPSKWLREEGRKPTIKEVSVLGPEIDVPPPKKGVAPLHETISTEFMEAREKAAKEAPDIFAEWLELAEPLVPTKKEREIAYPTARVGITPAVEFGAGLAYGAVTFVPSVIKMPETVYKIATDPTGTFKAITEKFVRHPTFAIGEIGGGLIAGYGIGKLAGIGIARVRAKGVTTEFVAGEYTFKDIAGKRIGLARARAVILKKKKPIARLDIETIYKPVKTGEISPAISRVIVTKPKPMKLWAVAKGITYPEVSGVYPGVSKAVLLAKGKPISAAAAAGITKVEPGVLKTVGISLTAPTKAKTVFGAMFREVKPPSPPVTIIRAVPKVVTKPGPPAVAVTTKAITKAVGKVITKPSPVITKVSALSGFVTPTIGRVDAKITMKPDIVGYPAFPSTELAESPWARRKKPIVLEEDVYISPAAGKVVGITGLVSKQKRISVSGYEMAGISDVKQVQQLGVDVVQIPKQPSDVIPVYKPPPPPQVFDYPTITKTEQPLVLKHPPVSDYVTPIPPPFVPPTVIPPVLLPLERKKVPRKKRPKVKPKYKYREIRHPFPSLKELMGV